MQAVFGLQLTPIENQCEFVLATTEIFLSLVHLKWVIMDGGSVCCGWAQPRGDNGSGLYPQ